MGKPVVSFPAINHNQGFRSGFQGELQVVFSSKVDVDELGRGSAINHS